MSDKTIRGHAISATYLAPDDGEPRISIRFRRRARKGAKLEYGDQFFSVELTLPQFVCRDLVRSVRNGAEKVREEKAQSLRSAESWLEEIRKAATP